MSTAVDNLADNLQGASIQDKAQQEAISASAAEGRRLYIGNLAYATTEDQLKEFFFGYDVYVYPMILTIKTHCPQREHLNPCQPSHQPSRRLCFRRSEVC